MDLYHVLNRGVEKRNIFLDDIDHLRFIHNLFEFNDKNNSSSNNGYYFQKNSQYRDVRRPYIGSWNIRRPRELLVHIHAFCLMPNHYHLLLSPALEGGVSLFMKKLNGGYAKYFNERYERSGALFQGKYKSVPIVEERHFLFIPFYIHFNPLDLKMKEWREAKLKSMERALAYLEKYRWSSHLDYLGTKNFPSLTQRNFFEDFFKEQGGYTKTVRENIKNFQIERFDEITLE